MRQANMQKPMLDALLLFKNLTTASPVNSVFFSCLCQLAISYSASSLNGQKADLEYTASL